MLKEWWNQFLERSKTIYANLTITQKILLGSIVGAFLVTMVLLIIWLNEPDPMGTLYSNLSAEDAGAIVAKLKEKKINYKIVGNGETIEVPINQVYDLRLELAQENLPSQSGVGYEIFDKSNFGVTDFVQNVNLKRALEGELVRSIQSLMEVRQARIHLNLPRETLFTEDQKPPSASIVLHLESGGLLSKKQIVGIQKLVALAVENLEPKNIVVLDKFGNILSPQEDQDDPVILSQKQMLFQNQLRSTIENQLKNKIIDVLMPLGENNFSVSVSVELDNKKLEQTIEQYNPEEQVVRSEQSVERGSSVTGDSERSHTVNYEISKTISRIEDQGSTVKRLTASVMVNGKRALQTNEQGRQVEVIQARNQSELDNIANLVQSAIGYNVRRGDMVQVHSMVFDESASFSHDAYTQEMERRIFWYKVSRRVLTVLALLLAFSFMAIFAHRYIKYKPEEAIPTLEEVPLEMEEEEIPIEEEIPGVLLEREMTMEEKRRLKTLEELRGMASSDANAMAQLIRTWLMGD